MNFEDEIDCLESVLSDLKSAIRNVQDSPYLSYMASSLKLDMNEVRNRLDELYELQNNQWKKEMQQQNFEYESGCLQWKD